MSEEREVYVVGLSGAFYHDALGGVVVAHVVQTPDDAREPYRGVGYRVIETDNQSAGWVYPGGYEEVEAGQGAEIVGETYLETWREGEGDLLMPGLRVN